MEEAMRLDTIRDVGDKGNMVIVLPGGATNEGASKALTDLIAANPVLEKMSGKR